MNMPTSRAKITLKDEELVKMLQKHQGALQQIQFVGKDQQGSLETKLAGLLLEMCQKTARMSHKVLAVAFKKAKLMKIDVEATCLKLIHAWTTVLEKLKHKKSGVGLSLLQKEFERVRMSAEAGDAEAGDAEAGDADTTDAGPMEEEKATNDPARLIHILHDSMEAKIVADGKSHMVPLVPGEKGLAVVKWHGEILQTLVSNKTLPASRLLEMSPMQVTASPAGSSTYPLVEIMEAWEDEEPDQAPQCIKDEDMDQDADKPDQDAKEPEDAEEPDQDAEEDLIKTQKDMIKMQQGMIKMKKKLIKMQNWPQTCSSKETSWIQAISFFRHHVRKQRQQWQTPPKPPRLPRKRRCRRSQQESRHQQ